MKFLFITPLTDYGVRPMNTWAPVGILSMAASLKGEGHEAALFDRHALFSSHGLGRDRIDGAMAEAVRTFRPDVIGFQTLSPLIHDTVSCAALLRPLFPGVMIAGGHHGTALPELTLRRIEGLDGVVAGEGEQALVRFARGEDPRDIPGFWWKDRDGGIRHTPPVQVAPLDDLPFPDYTLLDGRFYLQRNHSAIRGHFLSSLCVVTSRGCVRRCDFCCESLTYGRGVRFHSARYVAEGVRELLYRYPIDGLYVHDNDFLINRKRAEEICEHFSAIRRNRPFLFSIQARAERVDSDMVRRLKAAGCALIEIGVESALQENLDSVRKETTVAEAEEAIARCREGGISVHANMITGFEGETMEKLEKEIAWMKKVRPDTFSWFPLEIHPGTALYERRGDGFFERSPWTPENIRTFYRGASLSPIPPAEKGRWMKSRYQPLRRRAYFRHLFRKNYPRKLFPLLFMKGRREILKLRDRFDRFRNPGSP